MPPQEIRLPAIHPTDKLIRRLLDAGIALTLLVLLCPALLFAAVLVLFTSRGSLFYRQKRVGRDGHLFDICKFRTMQAGADRHGPSVTSADDCRITSAGHFLRRSKLDELPQLWNVVRGDMSLVGPRPQVPRFVDCFEPSLRRIVLHVRPGITGPTALHFRHEEILLADKPDRENFYIEQILPVKLQMDAEYVRNRSLRNDLRILTQTAWMFSGAHVQRALRFGGTRKHHGSAQIERITPDRETPTTDPTQEDIVGMAKR